MIADEDDAGVDEGFAIGVDDLPESKLRHVAAIGVVGATVGAASIDKLEEKVGCCFACGNKIISAGTITDAKSARNQT